MHTKTTNAASPDTQRCGFSRVSATALVVAGALLLGLSTPPAAASAQIRCWTNDSGSRECSDMPPPPNAKAVNEIRGRAGRIEGQESFGQRQASERFPVTLWSNDCGEPCASARKLLVSRGVPFTDRNPSQPALQEEFKRMTKGQMQVPILVVGTSTLVGYEEGQWNSTLDAAGYSRVAGSPRRPAAPAQGPAQQQPAAPVQAGPGSVGLPSQPAAGPGAPMPGSILVPDTAGAGPGGPAAQTLSPAGPAGSGAIPR